MFISQKQRKTLVLPYLALSMALITPLLIQAGPSSASYTITHNAVSSSGGLTSSISNQLQGTIGQSSITGLSHTSSYSLFLGFMSIPDTDGDNSYDNNDLDDDNDGLSDAVEATLMTNSRSVDSDNDGLSDYAEVNMDMNPSDYQEGIDSNPNNPDTDGDWQLDGNDPFPITAAPIGDIAPWGNPDGILNVADIVVTTRIIHDIITPTEFDIKRGDIYPPTNPDGTIGVADLILIKGLVENLP